MRRIPPLATRFRTAVIVIVSISVGAILGAVYPPIAATAMWLLGGVLVGAFVTSLVNLYHVERRYGILSGGDDDGQ